MCLVFGQPVWWSCHRVYPAAVSGRWGGYAQPTPVPLPSRPPVRCLRHPPLPHYCPSQNRVKDCILGGGWEYVNVYRWYGNPNNIRYCIWRWTPCKHSSRAIVDGRTVSALLGALSRVEEGRVAEVGWCVFLLSTHVPVCSLLAQHNVVGTAFTTLENLINKQVGKSVDRSGIVDSELMHFWCCKYCTVNKHMYILFTHSFHSLCLGYL